MVTFVKSDEWMNLDECSIMKPIQWRSAVDWGHGAHLNLQSDFEFADLMGMEQGVVLIFKTSRLNIMRNAEFDRSALPLDKVDEKAALLMRNVPIKGQSAVDLVKVVENIWLICVIISL